MTQNDKNNLDILAYLRGELSGEELKTIEALIAEDADFAADVEFQKTLRQTLQDNQQTETSSEFGWARLSKAIDAEAEAQAETDILPVPNDRQKPIQFWKYAALFLACAMFGQTYLMASTKSDDANDKYFMASEIEVQPHFTMKPSASLTFSTLTEALVQHNGLITMGPDENGQYEVSFQTLEACDATVKVLENSSEFFQTAKACEEG